jgi:hypothetical protein
MDNFWKTQNELFPMARQYVRRLPALSQNPTIKTLMCSDECDSIARLEQVFQA